MNCQCGNLTINQVKAKKLDIIAFSGDNFAPIIFKFWADTEFTIPIDITSWTFKAAAYSGSVDKLVFNLVKSDTNTLTMSYAGVINIITYPWYLKQITPSITTLRHGTFKVSPTASCGSGTSDNVVNIVDTSQFIPPVEGVFPFTFPFILS